MYKRKMRVIVLVMLVVSTTLANQVSALNQFIFGNNKFAASVYKDLASKSDDNFLVSPLSANLIVSLAQSGSKNKTYEEINQVLHHPFCKQITNQEVSSLLQMTEEDSNYTLQIINKMYLKNDFQVLKEFSTLAKDVYQTKIENLDFGCKYQAAKIINKWVEQETEDKIMNLIDPETISNQTRAVLVNALRFKANWSTPFHYFATKRQNFYSFDSIINLDTMNLFDEEFEFYEKPHLNATFLELPFEGKNVSMVIALPNDTDGLPQLEKYIDEVIETPAVKERDIFNVALPQFKLESRINFKDILKNLGVKKAFLEGEADFSGISGEKGEIFISDIVQKTFLEVDRNGVEAAAATYIVKIINRNGFASRDFIVDHPFIFYIKVNDLVVFLGRVITP